MRWILPFVLLLSGCASVVDAPSPGETLDLQEPAPYAINGTGFSSEQLQIIVAAFDEWGEHVCGGQIVVEITDVQGQVRAQDGPWEDEPRRMGRTRLGEWSALRTDLAPEAFRHTALHEIGHLLGAAAHHEKGGVMRALYHPGQPATPVTSADVTLVTEPLCSAAHAIE